MTLIKQKTQEELPEFKQMFEAMQAGAGFVPNSMLTMGHWPELLRSFSGLLGTIFSQGELSPELRQLIAFVISNAAGCRYCQAHTSHGAAHAGVSGEKIQAAFEFETSPLFTEAERAALRVALHAGMVPNAVTPEHMTSLGEYFSERQIVEIVGIVSLFGFLNRWNDTLGTTLESPAVAFASETLSEHGWEVSKHT